MEPQALRNPPPGPPAPRPDHSRWTPAKQRIFLAALLETGSVTRAARAAGMSRSSANRLRQRLAGTPFDQAWASVLAEHRCRTADPFGTAAAQPARA
jgi:hypothetical protein